MRLIATLMMAIPLLVLASCQAGEVEEEGMSEPGGEMSATGETMPTEADVQRIADQWVEAAEAHDAGGIASLYTEDAVFIGVEGQVMEGRQAIEEGMATGLEDLASMGVEATDRVLGTEMIAEIGTYTQTFQAGEGQEQTVSGRYLVVLKRQPDGSWKIAQHLGTPPSDGMPGMQDDSM